MVDIAKITEGDWDFRSPDSLRHARKALQAYDGGQFDVSLNYLRDIPELVLPSPAALVDVALRLLPLHMLRLNALRGAGRLRDACTYSEQLILLCPRIPLLHSTMAELLLEIDEETKAVDSSLATLLLTKLDLESLSNTSERGFLMKPIFDVSRVLLLVYCKTQASDLLEEQDDKESLIAKWLLESAAAMLAAGENIDADVLFQFLQLLLNSRSTNPINRSADGQPVLRATSREVELRFEYLLAENTIALHEAHFGHSTIESFARRYRLPLGVEGLSTGARNKDEDSGASDASSLWDEALSAYMACYGLALEFEPSASLSDSAGAGGRPKSGSNSDGGHNATERAASSCSSVSNSNPELLRLCLEFQFRALVNLSQRFLQAARFELALFYLHKLLDLGARPEFHELPVFQTLWSPEFEFNMRFNVARAYLNMTLFERAIPHLLYCVQLNAAHSNSFHPVNALYLWLAEAHEQLGLRERAIHFYERVVATSGKERLLQNADLLLPTYTRLAYLHALSGGADGDENKANNANNANNKREVVESVRKYTALKSLLASKPDVRVRPEAEASALEALADLHRLHGDRAAERDSLTDLEALCDKTLREAQADVGSISSRKQHMSTAWRHEWKARHARALLLLARAQKRLELVNREEVEKLLHIAQHLLDTLPLPTSESGEPATSSPSLFHSVPDSTQLLALLVNWELCSLLVRSPRVQDIDRCQRLLQHSLPALQESATQLRLAGSHVVARLPRYERWLLEDEERLLVGYRWMASVQLRCGGPIDAIASLEAARLCTLRSSLARWLYAAERARLDRLPTAGAGESLDGEAHPRSNALDERMSLELLDRLAAVRPVEYLTEEVLWSQLEATDRLLVFALSDASYAVLVIGRAGLLRTFHSARVRTLERALLALRMKTETHNGGNAEPRADSAGATTRRDEFFETRAFRALDPNVRDRLIPREFQLTSRDCAFACATQTAEAEDDSNEDDESFTNLPPERLLYRLLITPIEDLLAGATRVLLVPDGALGRNAELLSLLEDAASGVRLAERWRCTLVPSLYLLAKLFRGAQIAADLVAARETRPRAEITTQAETKTTCSGLSRTTLSTTTSSKSTKAAMPEQYTRNGHTTVTTRTATDTAILASERDIPRYAQVPALGRVLLVGSCDYLRLVTRSPRDGPAAAAAARSCEPQDTILPPPAEPPVYMPFRMEQKARAAEPAIRTQPATCSARAADPVGPAAPLSTSRSTTTNTVATLRSSRATRTSRDTQRDAGAERSESERAAKKSREVEAPLGAFGLPDGRCWRPIGNLPEALDELNAVRNVLLGRGAASGDKHSANSSQQVGTSRKSTGKSQSKQQQQLDNSGEEAHLRVVSGRAATKARFVEEAATASVVHAATYADLSGGALAFSAIESQATASAPADYLLSAGELARLQLPLTQLFVLSAPTSTAAAIVSVADESGNGNDRKESERPLLVELLLNAGVRAVLLVKRPLRPDVMRQFYTNFYGALLRAAWVSRALNEALAALPLDAQLARAAFALYGIDVFVDLRATLHSQLDQHLNSVERLAHLQNRLDFLHSTGSSSAAIPPPPGTNREAFMERMQQLLGSLFAAHVRDVESRRFLMADARPGRRSLLEQLADAVERALALAFEDGAQRVRVAPSDYVPAGVEWATRMRHEFSGTGSTIVAAETLRGGRALALQSVSDELAGDARAAELLRAAGLLLESSDRWRPHHLAGPDARPTALAIGPLDVASELFVRLRNAVATLLNAIEPLGTEFVTAWFKAGPFTQEELASLIDLLVIDARLSHVQLAADDRFVARVWQSGRVRGAAEALGFSQAGRLLRAPHNEAHRCAPLGLL